MSGGIIALIALGFIAYVACGALASYLAGRFDYSDPVLAGLFWPLFLFIHVVLALFFGPFLLFDAAVNLGRRHREAR